MKRKVIYDDLGSPTPKAGDYQGKDNEFVYIKTSESEIEAIPIRRVIRMVIYLDKNGDVENGNSDK